MTIDSTKLHTLKIKIFSSESLIPLSTRENYPHFNFHEAVKSGDVITSIDDHTHIIAILDTNTTSGPAISSGEIIDALRCGIKIYGASEIGAIRAKECGEMGMLGVGKIFDYLNRSFSFNQDWPYEDVPGSGFSYMDILFSLEKINNLEDHTKNEFLKKYELIHYSQRNLKTLENLFEDQHNLDHFFINGFPSQKKDDAALLLRTIQKDIGLIQKLNEELWEKQKQQFNESKCDLKWRSLHE